MNMKKAIALVLVLTATIGFSQEEQKLQEEKKWTFGAGVNFIDNTSTGGDGYLNTSQWNILPCVSTFGVERDFSNGFSADARLSLNEFEAENMQNGTVITRDVTYVAFDAAARYTFDQHLFDAEWFDATAVAGAGLFWVDGQNNQSGNVGMAFDFWFQPALGLRLQTLGKFAFEEETLGNNHLQHSLEFIVKF
ncbi:hypothetical protein FLJC2902T_19770 [Flavobacterium limnosediminis JC2902]|uniref:Outer membrane protein beta-barrel domain-containing protein n=1 Tax=Flavobacterium limnosediminis JC2902 TaxID=1341181 RepID=V6SLH7_9FLAO|nr:hypothetical protein [Flavobacterium limnosediminis]ESU27274.1 hypothetical protein FLJC2902T_19770 [Flavobacterium limnosediminis JC2902]